jgi:hypothetical protein
VSCDYPIFVIFAGNWSDGIDLAEESYARPYKPSPEDYHFFSSIKGALLLKKEEEEDYHLVGTFKQTFIG